MGELEMKDKPSITKGDNGWQVEMPAFGFQPVAVKDGFVSQKAAFGWLVNSANRGTSSSLAERSGEPNDGRYCNPWPMIIR